MNNTPEYQQPTRDFNSISPSARQLLLLKGFSDIPFARLAAQMMLAPKAYVANLAGMDFSFNARLMHFESRYRSIDELLAELPVKNMLELSSRGLDLIMRKDVNYIDTDLAEVIADKKNFIEAFTVKDFKAVGNLQTLPLNALDEEQLKATVKLFPPGEVAILTEGLLMYLNLQEKVKLFNIIVNVLQERGGYWIVADIYIRKEIDMGNVMVTGALQSFYDTHKIEENKFESFNAAEKLFNANGLIIDKSAGGDYSNLSGLSGFLSKATEGQADIIKNAGKIRATWRLKLAG